MHLIPVRYLFDRLRHSRRRADVLRELRTRLERAPDAQRATAAERQWAIQLARLREALTSQLGQVASCAGCASGHPKPFGLWPGGHCCGSDALSLFTDEELGSLKLAGTTQASMRAPSSQDGGCVFRSPSGCSLAPVHRPNLCVRFLCRDLEQELSLREDFSKIRDLQAELKTGFERFVAARQARIDDELLESMARHTPRKL